MASSAIIAARRLNALRAMEAAAARIGKALSTALPPLACKKLPQSQAALAQAFEAERVAAFLLAVADKVDPPVSELPVPTPEPAAEPQAVQPESPQQPQPGQDQTPSPAPSPEPPAPSPSLPATDPALPVVETTVEPPAEKPLPVEVTPVKRPPGRPRKFPEPPPPPPK